MRFEQAIKNLEKGKKLRRICWHHDTYIRLQGDLAHPTSCSIILNIDNGRFKPSYSEIKANDWEIKK